MSPRRNRNAGPRWKTNSGKVQAICEDCGKLWTPRMKAGDKELPSRYCKKCQGKPGGGQEPRR